MVRHPHTLSVTYQSEGTWANGNFVPGTTTTLSIKGRAEANGQGSLVNLEDGSTIVYNWAFYFTPITQEIPFGASATLTHNTGTWSGTIKRSAINQKGGQIWL